MKLLLDTHALIWWFLDDPALGNQVRATVSDAENNILVSPVSAYEMTLKYRLGRLPQIAPLLANLAIYLERENFDVLPVSLDHAQVAGELPLDHRDPFDRLLIAQAQIEQAWLVSNEVLFDQFGVRRLW